MTVIDDTDGLAGRLAEAFPDLGAPMLTRLGAGWASDVFVTDGGLVVRVGRNDWAWRSFELEQRLLPAIAPHLPVEVARITHLAGPDERFPLGVAVHRMIEGDAATPADMTPALAADVGAFLAALHRVPLDVARGAGVRALETRRQVAAWAPEADVLIEDDTVRAALRDWARGVHDGSRFSGGATVLCHFDAWCENLILRDGALAGVLDFGDATLAAPAAEFAALSYYGPAFLDAAIEGYRHAGGASAVHLDEVRDHLVYRELRGVTGATPAELPDELPKLRRAL
ncbi:MAG: phosphotransferase, partial [Dehalococcoidia bacterium]